MSDQESTGRSEASTLMNKIETMIIKIQNSYTLPLYFCLACFGIAILIGLLITQAGPGISPDSTGYISAAENVFSGKGFYIGYGEGSSPYTTWPPLYPLLIALLMHLGFSAELAACLIPIFSFGLLMFPLFFLGREIEGDLTGYLACIICLVSFTLWRVTSFAWTEMPYIFLSALALLCLIRYWKSDSQSAGVVILCGIFTALGILTRYIGVTVLLVGTLTIFLRSRDQIKNSIYHTVLYGTISLLPVGIWVIRNMLLGVPASGGERWGSAASFVENIIYTASAIGYDFLPFVRDYTMGVVIGIGIAIFFIVGMIWYRELITFTFPRYFKNNAIILSYILVYLSVLIMMSTLWHFDTINPRLTSPAYPFIILAGISFALTIRHRFKDPSCKKRLYAIILLVTVVYIFGQVSADIRFSQYAKEGQGYNAPLWTENSGIKYIEEYVPADVPIYNNEWYACRYLLGGRTTLSLPSSGNSGALADFIARCESQQLYVIYFKNSYRPTISIDDLDELSNGHYVIKEIVDYFDATVYRSIPAGTV